MKLTQQRLIEIIKEEYQNILNESKTVRLGDVNMIFHSKDDLSLPKYTKTQNKGFGGD